MKTDNSRVINRHKGKEGVVRTLKIEFDKDSVDIEFSLSKKDINWDKLISLHPNEAKSLMYNLMKYFNV